MVISFKIMGGLTMPVSEVVSTNMKIFESRLRRIVEESYEVAFILCNKELEEFSSSKIFDIFAQVFTTAYVLNTAYWPFFSTINGQCLCVCGRFGIPCRHLKNGSHWIDMGPIEHDSTATVFYPKLHGPVIVKDYEILVKAIDGSSGYYINIILNVQYKRNERGRPRRDKVPKMLQKDVNKKTYPMAIFSRFYTMSQYYSPLFTIIFQPNPFFNEYYGTLFKKLLYIRSQEFCVFQGEHHQMWYITYNQMPPITFVPYHVNVPVFKFPSQLMVYNQPLLKSRQHFVKNKSVQTNYEYSVSATGENVFKGYSVEESSITKSLQTFATSTVNLNSEAEEFLVIEDSEEFDSQWPAVGYNKVIKPNQLIVTHNSNIQVLIDEETKPHSNKRKLPIWSPKHEPDSTTDCESFVDSKRHFPSLIRDGLPTSEPTLNFSKALKITPRVVRAKNRDGRWFDKNFPPLKNNVVTNDLDAQFEIIENVIKDDVMEQEGNLDWWYNNKQQE